MFFSSQKLKPSRTDLRISKKQHWDGKRRGFFIAVGMSFCTLQLLFLMVMSLLYGSQYKTEKAVHNLHVLAVDYDGGLVGEALSQAYNQLQGDSFPTIYFEPASFYPDVKSIEDAVGRGEYWGAVYTWPEASQKLASAYEGGEAAATFNPQEMITFVWLEARYPTTSEGYIQSNLNQLVGASATALKRLNGTQALSTLDQSDPAAIQAYLNPIVTSSVNLRPINHGTRVLNNTASVALSIVQMFFFIMAINGVSAAMNLFSRLTVITNFLIRQGLAASYTFIAALLEVSYIWAFKENWQVSGYMFVLLWLVSWLHMWANFMVLDTAASLVPMQYMPFIVITYVILNITSSIVNIPMAPQFYRYAYAMPSHNWYELFITITTGGYVNTVYRSLPILFAWFIIGELISFPLMMYRCRNAQAAAQATEEPVAEKKVEDVEEQSSDSASYMSATAESVSEAPLRPQASNATSVARTDVSVRLARQPTSAYYPSIPVGFEGVERILSR